MFVLDTNVISALRVRRAENMPVWVWAEANELSSQFLSAMTIMELERGTLQLERKDERQGAILRAWLDLHILPSFSARILAIDGTVARRCASLHVPDPQAARDALIAATALTYGFAVVTRNVKDFQSTGVSIINPWTSNS